MSDEISRSLLINALWSIVGRFGYLIVGLITNIFLVRLLDPKEFGQVGIIMFFIIVASVLIESGLSGALVRKQDATEVDYSTLFMFNFVVSLLFMAMLIVSSEFIAVFYADPNLKKLLIISSLVLLINALRVSQTVKLIKELKFKRKAFYEFMAVLIASIIAIVLAFNGAGVWAIVALQLSTSAMLTIILWVFVGPLKSYKFSKKSFKQFYKFGINTTIASLLDTVFGNIYQLILGKYFLITQAGYFYQAKKLQEIPTGIINSTMQGVIYSALSKLKNTPKEFNKLYQNIVKIFTIVVAAVFVIIFYYSEIIVTSLYGEIWIASAFYLQMLIIASFFYLQEMLNRIIFKVFNKTEKILQLEVLKKTIQSVSIGYGIWTMSIENLLYGFVATNICSFFVNYYYARKVQNHFRWNELLIIIKVIILAAIVVFLCEITARSFQWESYHTLILLPILLLTYFLGLRLLNISNFFYDIKILLQLISKK